MRSALRPWAVAPALFAALAAPLGSGCSLFRSTVTYEPTGGSAAIKPSVTARLSPPADPERGAKVILHTRLVEQPGGDEYLTHGVWKDTTDPLPHELSTRLAVNGIRVGILTGQPPAEWEKVATSEAAAVNPMLRSFLAGRPKAIPVNGPLPRAAAAVRADLAGEPVASAWESADCGVLVTATPQPDGRLRLRVEFQIQHGERMFAFRPNGDGTAFDGRHQRTVEPFPAMAFDVTLATGDALLFGATASPAGTLGQTFFFPPAGDRVRQRVLMVQPLANGTAPATTDRPTPAGFAAK